MSESLTPGTHDVASLTRFDPLAPSYEGWFETLAGRYVDALEKALVLSLVEAKMTDRLLEVGSGTGYYLRELARSGARCTGIEPSAGMLAEAASRPRPAIEYVQGIGERLPFSDHTFNHVLFMTTLEFVQDADAAIREAARVLRPGGRLVLGVLNAAGPWAAARRREGGLWQAARFYEAADLEAMLEHLGPVRVTHCVYVPPALAGRLPAFLLEPADRLFRRLFPSRGALIGVAVTLRSES